LNRHNHPETGALPALSGHGWAKPTTVPSPPGDCGVPNVETRIGVPVAYASIIVFLPITRPTCPGEVGVPSAPAKNTRSPAITLDAATLIRWLHRKLGKSIRGRTTMRAGRRACWNWRGCSLPNAEN